VLLTQEESCVAYLEQSSDAYLEESSDAYTDVSSDAYPEESSDELPESWLRSLPSRHRQGRSPLPIAIIKFLPKSLESLFPERKMEGNL